MKLFCMLVFVCFVCCCIDRCFSEDSDTSKMKWAATVPNDDLIKDTCTKMNMSVNDDDGSSCMTKSVRVDIAVILHYKDATEEHYQLLKDLVGKVVDSAKGFDKQYLLYGRMQIYVFGSSVLGKAPRSSFPDGKNINDLNNLKGSTLSGIANEAISHSKGLPQSSQNTDECTAIGTASFPDNALRVQHGYEDEKGQQAPDPKIFRVTVFIGQLDKRNCPDIKLPHAHSDVKYYRLRASKDSTNQLEGYDDITLDNLLVTVWESAKGTTAEAEKNICKITNLKNKCDYDTVDGQSCDLVYSAEFESMLGGKSQASPQLITKCTGKKTKDKKTQKVKFIVKKNHQDCLDECNLDCMIKHHGNNQPLCQYHQTTKGCKYSVQCGEYELQEQRMTGKPCSDDFNDLKLQHPRCTRKSNEVVYYGHCEGSLPDGFCEGQKGHKKSRKKATIYMQIPRDEA